MSDEPDLPGGAGEQRELLARLRAVVEAKDSENAVLRAELSAALDRERRLELRIAELERRLGMDVPMSRSMATACCCTWRKGRTKRNAWKCSSDGAEANSSWLSRR